MSDNISTVGVTIYRADTKAKGFGHKCRVRTDAVIRGEVVKLDIAAADQGTSETIGLIDLGTDGTGAVADSGHTATVLPILAATTAGVVGVALEAVADNGVGHFEFGIREVGTVVRALVLVDAASTKGAELIATAAGGYGILTPASVGVIYGILLEAATADDGSGPSASYNLKRVLFRGVGGYGFRQT